MLSSPFGFRWQRLSRSALFAFTSIEKIHPSVKESPCCWFPHTQKRGENSVWVRYHTEKGCVVTCLVLRSGQFWLSTFTNHKLPFTKEMSFRWDASFVLPSQQNNLDTHGDLSVIALSPWPHTVGRSIGEILLIYILSDGKYTKRVI